MSQLYRVLYCSRNSVPGGLESVAADIANILAVSRSNNARDGITGGLLFSRNCFAQVLEGTTEAVEAAFERIQCDERHSDVTVLQAGPIAARDFPGWSMAFTGADTASPLASVVMAHAFSGQSSAGGDVLDTLKQLVVRETKWLAPLHEPRSRCRGEDFSYTRPRSDVFRCSSQESTGCPSQAGAGINLP